MNIVDSSGWIEYFTKGPNGAFFQAIIQETTLLLVPSITIYEVMKHVLLNETEESALQSVGIMSSVRLVDLDRDIAVEAARISASLKLAMADSIILATARAYDATLWTQDAHFKEIEAVQYIEKKP
jgi:toxin FitB